MTGIAASPISVAAHPRTPGLTREYLERRNLDEAQILLMVNPGMMTEARPCQVAASMNASMLRL